MIVFARHGQTAPNRDGLVLGRADPELTDEGHRQAALLGAALGGEPVTAIVTSPLVRARQTAEVIAAACGLPVTVDERLVEIDWGTWEGRPTGSLAAADLDRSRGDGTVAWRMFLGLASITRVGRGRTSPVLLSFNETGHLQPVEDREQ